MRIVLMTIYKQALRRASRAMFNARLIALAIDVDLPHCDAPHRRKPVKMLQPRHAQATKTARRCVRNDDRGGESISR
jgi:hypothetical protein